MNNFRLRVLCSRGLVGMKPANLEAHLLAFFEKLEINGKLTVHFMGRDERGPFRDFGTELLVSDPNFVRLRVWVAKNTRPYVCAIVPQTSSQKIYEKLGGRVSREKNKKPISKEQRKMLRKGSVSFAQKMEREWQKRKERVVSLLHSILAADSKLVKGSMLRGAVIQICPKTGRTERYYEIVKRLKKDGVIRLLSPRGDGEESLYEILV